MQSKKLKQLWKTSKHLQVIVKLGVVWFLFYGMTISLTGETNALYTTSSSVIIQAQAGEWEIAEDEPPVEEGEPIAEEPQETEEEPIKEKDASKDKEADQEIEAEKEKIEKVTEEEQPKEDEKTKEEQHEVEAEGELDKKTDGGDEE
ncbi:hypothetical protein [Cytobacillus purgationiresistens]|uniref:YqxM protein n=1 Tax=Cytobacillus purgationiresistens TaxID=863449 RepID=A0ABU0AAS1_9BACI|nr:hypothetical protein [Cytobacillus purgationiresistens]MDQ0268346.1 hypothetical protein [Cytobacillus purgationiresistens]